MSEIVRYTVRQACEIMGAELPQEYNYLADEVLTNITHSVNTLSPGGAFLLFGKTSEERKKSLRKPWLSSKRLYSILSSAKVWRRLRTCRTFK